jgi:5-methylcytosine-specific restriction endonuclease McrA
VPRSVETVRRGLKPSQQARILERDGRCLLSGRTADDVPLTVAHLISVKDGLDAGLTDAEINDDANLAAMCESCNLGLGGRSVAPTTLIRHAAVAVRAQIARRDGLPVMPLGR